MDDQSREPANSTQGTLDIDGPSANEIDLLLKSEQLYGVEDYLREEATFFAEPGLQISQILPFGDLPDSTSPQQNPTMLSVSSPVSTGPQPSMVDYPGPYHFDVEVTKSGEKVKWEHSITLNKLFVVMNTNIPLKIKVNPVEPELYVRVLPIYLSQDSFTEAVKRCPTHMSNLEKSNQGFPYVEHIIRCFHKSASYQKNVQSGRYSVVVPTELPQPGRRLSQNKERFPCLELARVESSHDVVSDEEIDSVDATNGGSVSAISIDSENSPIANMLPPQLNSSRKRRHSTMSITSQATRNDISCVTIGSPLVNVNDSILDRTEPFVSEYQSYRKSNGSFASKDTYAPDEDEDHYYMKYILCKVKKLEGAQKLNFKLQLERLLYECTKQ